MNIFKCDILLSYKYVMKNSEEVQIASHNNVHIILFLLHVSVFPKNLRQAT